MGRGAIAAATAAALLVGLSGRAFVGGPGCSASRARGARAPGAERSPAAREPAPQDGPAAWEPLVLGAALGLALSLAVPGGAALAARAKLTEEESELGNMVFSFNYNACRKVARGAEPMCDDIMDYASMDYASGKPPVRAADRLQRWSVARQGDTVTSKLDEKCFKALAKLIDAASEE